MAVLALLLWLLGKGAPLAIPIPVLLGGLWIYAAEKSGLCVTEWGIESKMTRRADRFRYAWTAIGGFDVVDNGFQCAIVMVLRDGGRRLLPSTRAWVWDRARIQHVLEALEQQRVAAELNGPATGSN